MNKKRFFVNILKVGTSNILTIISGAIVGFVLPKIIGITNYGYYKTFSLYICYASLFQFGIIEGIYLKYGGMKYEDLEKEKFRYYTRFLMLLEVIISLLFIVISLAFLKGEAKFIFVAVSIFILFQNITMYYQYISQMTGRFSELSIRNVIKSLLTALVIVGMWLYHHFYNDSTGFLSYKIYTVAYVVVFMILSIWYIFTYRDITFGRVKKDKNESFVPLMKIGIPLLIANLCATLIFSIDRQFVNIFFDIKVYGAYSFAYNMLSLVTVSTSAIAVVIYPTLKTSNKESLVVNYKKIIMIFNIFIFFCLMVYFPLDIFVNYFFEGQEKYIESLPIFRVILPSLVLSCTITVIIHNYFMSLDKNKTYFMIVLFVLFSSIAANCVAYYVFKTTFAISVASVIITLIWYMICNIYLQKQFQNKWIKNFIYVVVLIIAFYAISSIETKWIGLLIYMGIYLITTILFYFSFIKDLILKLKKGKKKNDSIKN